MWTSLKAIKDVFRLKVDDKDAVLIARLRRADVAGALRQALDGTRRVALLGIPHVVPDDNYGKIRALHDAWTADSSNVPALACSSRCCRVSGNLRQSHSHAPLAALC
jgi:hypothetical protein